MGWLVVGGLAGSLVVWWVSEFAGGLVGERVGR